MMKVFNFRLYSTIDQSNQLNQHIGSCRFVYNWALDRKLIKYEQIRKSISRFDLNKLIPILKKQNMWLGKVTFQSLQGMTKQVESAFTKFFREKIFFLNSNQSKIQFSHFQYHNTTIWILKIILLSFLRLEKSKYFLTKHLKRN